MKKVIKNPNIFRENIVNKLETILKNRKDSINLEKGIYNYTIKESNKLKVVKKWDNEYFILLYLNKLKSVYLNIKDNEFILNELRNDNIKSYEIAFMSHQELKPEKWTKLINEKIIRDKNKFENNIEGIKGIFKCKKCKGDKVTYTEVQIRSADESCNVFIQCCNPECGNRWKI